MLHSGTPNKEVNQDREWGYLIKQKIDKIRTLTMFGSER